MSKLEPWMIDFLKKIKEKKENEDRPFLELPIPYAQDERKEKEEEQKKNVVEIFF